MTRAPARSPPGAKIIRDEKSRDSGAPAAPGRPASRSQTPPRRDALTAQGSGPGAPRPRHPRHDGNRWYQSAPEMIAATSRFICLHFLLRSRGDADGDSRAREASRLADRSCGAASLVWRLTFACASLSISEVRCALEPEVCSLSLHLVHRLSLSLSLSPPSSSSSTETTSLAPRTRSYPHTRSRAISRDLRLDLAPSRAISA